MFYAHFVLAKKGPLARIWLAAHWDKKLTKAHVFETNIESSVEGILQPKVKMALRTSGHLLLGIVRIYSRKAKYLLADCNEAFIKIKIAFRPGVVDLPEGNREAAVSAITLPEVFHDFDTALPDISIDMDAQVSLNQSRAEDITLKEDYGNLSLMADDGFDDMGFDEPEAGRDAVEDGFEPANLLLCGDEPGGASEARASEQPSVSGAASLSLSGASKHKLSLDGTLKDDGFGGTVGEGLLDGDTGGLFEPAGLFDDAPLGPVELDPPAEPTTSGEHTTLPQDKPLEQNAEEDSDDDIYDMAPGSMGAPSPPSSPESPSPEAEPSNSAAEISKHALPEPDPMVHDLSATIPNTASMQQQQEEMPPPPVPAAVPDVATLVHHDAESFALAPLDAMVSHGAERVVKAKRKRKLVVDEVKSISGEEMKSQLSDTTDIVATLDLAPPTKRLMHWKETGGVEKLFSLPGHRILSKTLTKSYLRHLTTRSVENETYGEDDQDELESEIDKPRDEDISESNKRRRLMEPDGGLPQDLSQLDAFPLETTRPSFPPSEPSLDPFHFNILHTPDLPHIPHVMDAMGSQGPSLNSITPSLIHSEASSLMEQQHLLAGLHPEHLQAPPQQPEELMPPPPEYVPPSMPQNGGPSRHHINSADDEATQPLADTSQFMPQPTTQENQQPEPMPEIPPEAVPPSQPILPQQQNGTLPDPQTSAQNLLFDSLIGDLQHSTASSSISGTGMTSQMPLNDLGEDGGLAGKVNDFGGSDDEAHDYEAPASVGPAYPEEQMADETYEQFEERILTKRTTVLLHSIHTSLDINQSVSFGSLVANNRRKQVAQKFYTFLVLKKQHAVELHQDSTFSDLIITRGPKYEAVLSN